MCVCKMVKCNSHLVKIGMAKTKEEVVCWRKIQGNNCSFLEMVVCKYFFLLYFCIL